MPDPSYDQRLSQAIDYVLAGNTKTDAALKFSLGRKTVAKAVDKAKASSAIPKQALDEMRLAAKESGDEEFENPKLIWEREERLSRHKIKKATAASDFRWRAPSRHVIISALSDLHIAPGTPVDFTAMREDAELIAKTPNCYAIFGGDVVDNHIKHRTAILNARSTPEDQYKLFEYYLSIFGSKVLLAVSGNHDDWTKQFAGVDLLSRIFQDNRVFYNPDEAYMQLEVGNQKYIIGIRHQYRFNSSVNQTHAVKQWLRFGERDFDVGIICHHHEHAIEQTVWRGQLRWVCRPGSYQTTSAYSRQFGYNQTKPTSPAFLFRGDTREIHGFPSVKAAIDCQRAMAEMGM